MIAPILTALAKGSDNELLFTAPKRCISDVNRQEATVKYVSLCPTEHSTIDKQKI